jgi:hypothetical protein
MVTTVMKQILIAVFNRLYTEDGKPIAKLNTMGMVGLIMEEGGMTLKKAEEWLNTWQIIGYVRYHNRGSVIERCKDVDHPREWFDEKDLDIKNGGE